jgi:hypothetical protein
MIILSGDRFGKLLVIKKSDYKKNWFDCLCDCGNTRTVASHILLSGHLKSCGCNHINTYEFFDNFFLLGFENNDIKFIIDTDDYEKIKGIPFYPSFEDGRVYLKMYYNKKVIRFSRFIMNVKSGEYVDHINKNSLDNRKINLRIVTNQQNGFNHNLSKKNTSGICGVQWIKQREIWHAKIKLNYKEKFIGSYENFEDAVRARLLAEKEYFGEEFAPQRHLFAEYGII